MIETEQKTESGDKSRRPRPHFKEGKYKIEAKLRFYGKEALRIQELARRKNIGVSPFCRRVSLQYLSVLEARIHILAHVFRLLSPDEEEIEEALRRSKFP